MNLIRWKKIFNSDLYYYYNQTPESLKNFFKERKNFLDEVMIDIENYNLIYVCPYNGSDYYILTVKNGDLPDLEKLKSIEPESFVKWVDEETGEEFDTTKPITHDVKIKAETLVETSTVNEISKLITKIKWHINKLIALGTLGLLILAMGAFIFIDIRRNKLGGGYFE
jgi:hypothetical protein